MENKIVYKVVSIEDGKLVSCNMVGNARTTYFQKKFVRAPKVLRDNGNHLLAFDCIESARDFLSYNGAIKERCKVFKAYARGEVVDASMAIMNRCWISFANEKDTISRILKSEKRGFPSGSLSCEEIRLVEEVEVIA